MNRDNALEFARELEVEAKKVATRHRKVVGLAALHALRVAVERSPVDTGALRNNWQVGTTPDVPASKALGGDEGSPPTPAQFAQSDEATTRLRPFGSLFLVNPMPYASFVDEGTPRMAARPMVEPAIAAAEAVIRQAGESA